MSTLKKIKVMSERLPELGEVSSVVTGVTLELRRSHSGIAARQRKQHKGPEAGQSLPCSRYQKETVWLGGLEGDAIRGGLEPECAGPCRPTSRVCDLFSLQWKATGHCLKQGDMYQKTLLSYVTYLSNSPCTPAIAAATSFARYNPKAPRSTRHAS